MSIYPHATMMTVAQCRQRLAQPDEGLAATLSRIYGADATLHDERLALMWRVIEAADTTLDPSIPCALIRVPGRINTMGIHTDTQYSWKNHVVFGREIVALVQPRTDDVISLHSPHQAYPDYSFGISDLLPDDERGSDWMEVVEAAWDHVEVGAWQNYTIGPMLALQNHYSDRQLCGLDLVVDGDIPMAAGVSSSSALATLAGIAAIHFNQLDIPMGEAIRVIGAGEWYCGSRGGPGDTGAQMLCRRGHVLHVKYDIPFDPYEEHHIPFPDDWRIVLCNTLVEARKSVGGREKATARGLSQVVGATLLREMFPEHAERIKCVADLTPENLGVPVSRIYEMFQALPIDCTNELALKLAGSRAGELERPLRHWRIDQAEYPLRSPCMWTLCEPARGARNRLALERRDEAEMRVLLQAAHDGDRIVRWLDDERGEPYDNTVSDDALARLIHLADSSDAAERESAQLYRQPGGFGCSCPELDLLVDICDGVDGVIGSRVTGAGMGGCMFAYAHREAVPDLLRQVKARYYERRGLPLAAWELLPSDRGGPLVLAD